MTHHPRDLQQRMGHMYGTTIPGWAQDALEEALEVSRHHLCACVAYGTAQQSVVMHANSLSVEEARRGHSCAHLPSPALLCNILTLSRTTLS